MSEKQFCHFCFQPIYSNNELEETARSAKCTLCGSTYHLECWHRINLCSSCENTQIELIFIDNSPPIDAIRYPITQRFGPIDFGEKQIRRFLAIDILGIILIFFASVIVSLWVTLPFWSWILVTTLLLFFVFIGIVQLSQFSGLSIQQLFNQKWNLVGIGLAYPDFLFQWQIKTAYQRLIIQIVFKEVGPSKIQIQNSLKKLKVPLDESILADILEQLVGEDWLSLLEDKYYPTKINLLKVLFAQIGEGARVYLIQEIQRENSLYQVTSRFLALAGMRVNLSEFSGFQCTSFQPIWSDLPSLYVRIMMGRVLDSKDFIEIVEDAKKIYSNEFSQPIIILTVNHQLHFSHLHQILALHADHVCTIIPISKPSMLQAMYEERSSELLREQIDLFIGRRNLYNIRTTVTDVLSFFGRQSLIADLNKNLVNGQSIIIFGVRKIGKSSLINRLQEELPWPTASFDLEGYINGLQFIYFQIIETWKLVIRTRYSTKLDNLHQLLSQIDFSPDTQPHFFLQATKELLRILDKIEEKPGLIIFFDEMDMLLNEAEYYNFASILRSIVEDPFCRDRITILMAGLDPVLNRKDHIQGTRNPFYSFFEEFPVGPLSLENSRGMVVTIGMQMGISYTDEALDILVKSGGGHPFLTRQLCSQTIQDKERPLNIKLQYAEQAIEVYLNDPNNYFAETLWPIDTGGPSKEESELLKILAKKQPCLEDVIFPNNLSLADKRQRQLALSHLKDQSLVYKDNHSNTWNLTIPLYKRWMRHHILNLTEAGS